MNNIKIRTSRRWQISLAKSLGCHCTCENETNVKVNNLTLTEKVKKFNKNISAPSLEWLLDVSPCMSMSDVGFIETGSRLYNTKKQYICYVENGLGIFSYNTNKINKINIPIVLKMIKKDNFKGFVFYSEATEKSFINLFSDYQSVMEKSLGVIYPYTHEKYYKFHNKLNYRVGFCSSNFYLKGGLEVIEAAKKKPDINFDIVTRISDISEQDKKEAPSNINFIDFNLSEDAFMTMARDKWDIYLHPTFFDTVPLAPIEMLKCGLPIIATDTFAISEYIEKYNTGVVVKNPRSPFSQDYFPKEQGPLGKTLASLAMERHRKDDNLVSEIVSSIDLIYSNYGEYQKNIETFCFDSEFSEDYIIEKWKSIVSRSFGITN